MSIGHTLGQEVFERQAREVGRDILDQDEDGADDESPADHGVEVGDTGGGEQLRGEERGEHPWYGGRPGLGFALETWGGGHG